MSSHCNWMKQTKNAVSFHRKPRPLVTFPSTPSLILFLAQPIRCMCVESASLVTCYLGLHVALPLSSPDNWMHLPVLHLKINDQTECGSEGIWRCILKSSCLFILQDFGTYYCLYQHRSFLEPGLAISFFSAGLSWRSAAQTHLPTYSYCSYSRVSPNFSNWHVHLFISLYFFT